MARAEGFTRAKFMRFALWANSHKGEGDGLTVDGVCAHWGLDRATGYRWLADYFDAKGWTWPRAADRAPAPTGRKCSREERYAAFNRP